MIRIPAAATTTMANILARRGASSLLSASSSSVLPALSSVSVTPSSSSPSSLPSSISIREMTILSKESASEFQKQNYSARMAATQRPVSPHVTIYSFPICALTSIATRVSGCMLSFGSAGLGAVELFGGSGAAFELMSNLGTVGGGSCASLAALGSVGLIVPAVSKFAVAFPLGYHYLGGVRHFVWDNSPNLLENVGVEKASYALIGTSLLLGGVSVVV